MFTTRVNTRMRLLCSVASFTFLARYIGGKPVSLGFVLCGLIALDYALNPPASVHPGAATRWRRGFVLFIAVGLGSLVLSPFAGAALSKGLVQVVGLAVVILAGSAIAITVAEDPQELTELVRRACVAAGVLGAVAVYQSVVTNVLRVPELGRFEFLNTLAGGSVWHGTDALGPLVRANSLCREPAHLCLFLGLGAAVAVLRVGILGPRLRRAAAPLLGTATAFAILAGFVVSLSLLGLLQLALVIAFAWFACHRIEISGLVALILRAAVVAVLAVVMLQGTRAMLVEKAATLVELGDPTAAAGTIAVSASAVTLAIQVEVVATYLPQHPLLGIGFGAHPIAYELAAPPWAERIPGVWLVNADDAAALILRLLSETGLAGTFVYLASVMLVCWRARAAILDAKLADKAEPDAVDACAIAVTAAMASLTIICFARYAFYYEPLVWIVIALTGAVPALLLRAADRTSAL